MSEYKIVSKLWQIVSISKSYKRMYKNIYTQSFVMDYFHAVIKICLLQKYFLDKKIVCFKTIMYSDKLCVNTSDCVCVQLEI